VAVGVVVDVGAVVDVVLDGDGDERGERGEREEPQDSRPASARLFQQGNVP
jgi:hypothetical protein